MPKRRNLVQGVAQLPRRKSLSRKQVRLAIASLDEGVNKTKFCEQHGISRSSLYAWQNALLDRLAEGQ